MLFNSFAFLVFFPVVASIYFALPHRFRWAHVLLASCYFYMAFVPVYILILGFTIVVDYFAGILIEGSTGIRRKTYLIVSLAANIGVLAVFKYYNFLNETAAAVAGAMHVGWNVPNLGILLPIGLSFHTFQAMSYTIEVYRGDAKAERHFGIYALYVMFFPQLVAGPIERPQNLLPQFHAEQTFSAEDARVGLRLILLGFVKKVVVADRAAVVVDHIYDNPGAYSSPWLIVATIFFAFQIYADFSGYSDIAIGTARILGFRLMVNFRRPYLAQSISEFWKRWHISLSTWFRDYLYIPLGGNRRGAVRWQLNLFLTFLVSGLWHGASWTFVIWGAINGFYLVVANLTGAFRERLGETLGLAKIPRLVTATKMLVTFGLVCFAWVFFRARTLGQASLIVSTIVRHAGDCLRFDVIKSGLRATSLQPSDLVIGGVAIVALWLFDFGTEKLGGMEWFERRPTWQRWAAYYAGTIMVIGAGKFGLQQFIYFQF